MRVIKKQAFSCCETLRQVSFPKDSQLERIENIFSLTKVRSLFLPPSVKEIAYVHKGMEISRTDIEKGVHLSIHVDNEFYKSNQEGTMILSGDGSELVYIDASVDNFKIPDGVRVLKKHFMSVSEKFGNLIIPASVEVIENRAFDEFCYVSNNVIEFEPGSKLKSIGPNSFPELYDLIINNKHFVKHESGSVVSLNPLGIVFASKSYFWYTTTVSIDHYINTIHSYSFSHCKIEILCLPKSLKIIGKSAFDGSQLKKVTFEEGTVLDYIF